jgi:hypothetical protein
MRRRGFIMPTVILMLTLFTLAAGFMIEGVSAGTSMMESRTSYRRQADAASVGVKIAEDWLLSSITDKSIPRRDPASSGAPLEKIEALAADGSSARFEGRFDGFEIEIYIADADYESGALDQSPRGIPRIPEESSADGVRRFYHLIGAAKKKSGDIMLTSEELIAVFIDKSGNIKDVSRLFYKSTSYLE